ncbi:Asp-tRNA(Asn)/Glu-tRNA(Gln) amidotransferase subunit GatC [Panacagrimonas sp.]|uniref:Asp-tRNA(Asn)/Glu-tRNA(Gln) amidotransferase subunit GatC n=1 Tax=Panacagrimonas sp. TaxID=2480088 RepID=UPI003B51EEA6
MSLSADQIRQVAHLARLELRADEVDHYARQISSILEMVDQLSTADTAGVTPMAHPLAMVQRLRPDAVTEPDLRSDYQAHAPAVQDGLFVVPKVIE